MTTTSCGPWPGRFVWHDLMTKDAQRAQEFYTALFDWCIEERPMGAFTYRMIHCGPGPIGGIVEEKNIPVSHWMPYLGVENVDVAVARVTELGGSVCVPATDIPNTGRFAVVNDPAGAYLSLYKGNPESQGADPDHPVPGRVCWNETYSTKDEVSRAFYAGLVGWRSEPKEIGPGGPYYIQWKGDRQAGGLMKHPMPSAPSCWVAYFLTTDLAASTARAKELGATAMMESVPIPAVGAFSMLTDPTGAMFSLFQPSGPPGGGECG